MNLLVDLRRAARCGLREAFPKLVVCCAAVGCGRVRWLPRVDSMRAVGPASHNGATHDERGTRWKRPTIDERQKLQCFIVKFIDKLGLVDL